MYGQTIYGGLYWGLDVWSDHLRWTVLGGARCMVRPSTVDCTGGGLESADGGVKHPNAPRIRHWYPTIITF